MERNKGRTLIVVLLLIITIMSLILAMYAWARYTTQGSGTATAGVAKWNFNLRLKEGKENAIETTEKIDLASTQFNHVANDRIAPGTSGLFYVIIDTTGTEVDCQYDVNITLDNCPRNIKFYRGTDATGEELSLGGVNDTSRSFNFSKYLAVKKDDNGTIKNENGKHEEPIYWKWEYQGEINGSATTYDQWDTADGKLGTTTMTITATGTEMLGEPLTSKIKANNYGDTVNYSVTVKDGVQVPEGTDGAVTLDNWKIFYNDGTYVYMIYGDYLQNTAIDTTKTGMTLQSGTTYQAYWASGSLTAPENKSAVATLTNTNNWSQLLTPELVSKGAIAQGGVTADIWAKSWNAKGYTPVYVDSTSNSDGDLIGTSNPVPVTSENLLSDTAGYSDNLYFPRREQISESGPPCNDYCLASPAFSTNSLWFVTYWGCVHTNYYAGPIFACRPVVSLPSSIFGEYENGTWNLK